MRRFVFLGAPGVGKGTFAGIISKRLSVPLLGLGDLLRAEVASSSALGRELEQFTRQGKLAPDRLTNDLLENQLRQLTLQQREQQREPGFLLDGYPRTLAQAEHLDTLAGTLAPVERVMHITLEEWVAVSKVLGRRVCKGCRQSFNTCHIVQDGYDMPAMPPDFDSCPEGPLCPRELHSRADDTEETVKKRFAIFHEENAGLLAHYSSQGKLRTFTVKRGIKDTDALLRAMLS